MLRQSQRNRLFNVMESETNEKWPAFYNNKLSAANVSTCTLAHVKPSVSIRRVHFKIQAGIYFDCI